MQVVLWDTRRRGVTKDFGGGFGMGEYHGQGGVRGRFIRRMYRRDRRPVALNFAYLAAIFRQLGHDVRYSEDDVPAADLYLFNPALATLDLERDAMRQARTVSPRAAILVVGAVAQALPDEFAGLDVTVVRGEPEQLLWKLDEALAARGAVVDVGSVQNLDALPSPDWAPFAPRRFRVRYDFTRFPTALVQLSRGCTYKCNYCPYILVESRTRFRSPTLVAAEMAHGMRTFGFRSFKFRDPLFGLNPSRTAALVEAIGRLPRRVQFSIETRIDLLNREKLVALRRAGLTSVTVGVETPDENALRSRQRRTIADDRQMEFVATCRELGIRTAVGFMIGFPDDTASSIRRVLAYARRLNPTYANFNIVTPYPGTPFYEQNREQISAAPLTDYTMYAPVMRYEHLTPDEVLALHAKCFTSYYFRWPYLLANAPLLWPALRWLRPKPGPGCRQDVLPITGGADANGAAVGRSGNTPQAPAA
jgi:radical SAM superfamily enzyme YgiQ (UPF0313 family)